MVPGWTEREMQCVDWRRRNLIADVEALRQSVTGSSPPDVGSITSRRRLLITVVALAAAALDFFGFGGARVTLAKRNKKKRKKRDRCRLLRGGAAGWFACGNRCCHKGSQVCCADPSAPSGKSCQPRGTVCCPREFGTGPCEEDQQCCPPDHANDENGGCCAADQPCCNDTADCDEPGAQCLSGCCVTTLSRSPVDLNVGK